MVESAQSGEFKFGMHTELILKFIGKPDDRRNKLITEEGKSEKWYYDPVLDSEGKPKLDRKGEIIHKTILVISNDKISKILVP